MGRLFTWLAGAAGGLAAYRAVARRKPGAADAAAASADPDPAQELRAKLAESRAEEPEPDGSEARRRDVHEQARSALDEMHGGGT